jgi:pimeloyl-ACP methyl ester carboxylesterase
MYFPGSDGKQTVPVILLHGWNGPRGAGGARDFDDLAAELQAAGHAVIVPDLRGHGGSKLRRTAAGRKVGITRRNLGPRGLNAMVMSDVEAVKRFLIDEHNQGELNIELLCVVGCEMGAAVAANWTAQDWAWPKVRGLKQGKDVRALVLISPLAAFRNLSVTKAMKFAPMQKLPMMIVHGNHDENANRAAKQIYKLLDPHHRATTDAKKRTFVKVEQETSLQGAELLNPRLDTIKRVREFIQRQVVDRRDRLPWRPRASADEQS